ncbi:MAG: hypothetical protein A2019_03700 [Sulfurimonas sp. GWF2_37_8]|nr:MAG: hypothetical protein A2019_03700 [Sulfurimonas sp. GWF2_37_8]
MGYYDVAQVCLNGHVINDNYKSSPEFNQDFCDQCGEKTITECLSCHEPIRGDYHVEGIFGGTPGYTPPSYCYKCGNAFSWIQMALDSAKELLDIDEAINDADKETLMDSMKEISKNTPKTELNAIKIKKIAKKLGTDTYDAFIKIAVDIGTEIAKKSLLGS